MELHFLSHKQSNGALYGTIGYVTSLFKTLNEYLTKNFTFVRISYFHSLN